MLYVLTFLIAIFLAVIIYATRLVFNMQKDISDQLEKLRKKWIFLIPTPTGIPEAESQKLDYSSR